MHTEYDHLEYSDLLEVIQSWEWWHSMNQDLQMWLKFCSQCQIAQGQKKDLDCKIPQHIMNPLLQPFKCWGIDLISQLSMTLNDN